MTCIFLFQAEDGIRDLVRSRGLGDVYKMQGVGVLAALAHEGLVPQPLDDDDVAHRVDERDVGALSLIHI